MKTTIYIESFGEYVRATLKNINLDDVTRFRNLSWLCLESVPYHEFESFMTTKKRLHNSMELFKDTFEIVEVVQHVAI